MNVSHTIGGYIVIDFEKLPEGIDTGHLLYKPMVYRGIVVDPIMEKHIPVFWDEDGRCNNPERNDCDVIIQIKSGT